MTIGVVVSASDVQSALLDTLRTWVPSVLAEVVRRRTGGTYQSVARQWPIPKTWQSLPNTTEEVMALAGDQFPIVVVAAPGLAEASIHRDGDGSHAAAWDIEVFALIRGRDLVDVRDRVGVYAAAIRVAACQHRIDLVGARRAEWRGEEYDGIVGTRKARSLGAAAVRFTLTVDGVLNDREGPAEPPAGPEYPDAAEPIADTVTVTTSKLSP